MAMTERVGTVISAGSSLLLLLLLLLVTAIVTIVIGSCYCYSCFS